MGGDELTQRKQVTSDDSAVETKREGEPRVSGGGMQLNRVARDSLTEGGSLSRTGGVEGGSDTNLEEAVQGEETQRRPRAVHEPGVFGEQQGKK